MNCTIRMDNTDVYHFTLLSMIAYLTEELKRVNTRPYRVSRLETVLNLLGKIETSYEGYIPEQYQNRAEKFLRMMQRDMENLLADINKTKG